MSPRKALLGRFCLCLNKAGFVLGVGICMIGLAACDFGFQRPLSQNPSQGKLEQIRIGMTQEEVKKILGIPDQKTCGPGQIICKYYQGKDKIEICFINRKVTKIALMMGQKDIIAGKANPYTFKQSLYLNPGKAEDLTDEKLKQIKIGMTRDAVVDVLGKPQKQHSMEGTEIARRSIFTYTRENDTVEVQFIDGKVVEAPAIISNQSK